MNFSMLKPGFHLDFLCLLFNWSFWFFQLRCPFLLSLLSVAFCCLSLLVVALSGFSLLLMPSAFHRSRAEANK